MSTESASSDDAKAKSKSSPMPELIDMRVVTLAALFVGIALLGFPRLNDSTAVWSNNFMSKFRKQPPTDQTQWHVGGTAVVDLTVVTADVWRLACASDQVFEGTHCPYKADKTRWPQEEGEPVDDNRKNVIQPYRTENGNLLITVSGLWAQPEIAMRVHKEPPRVVPAKRQKRFTARCEVKFIGELEKAKLQWNQSAQWFDQDKVLAGRAEKCWLKQEQ